MKKITLFFTLALIGFSVNLRADFWAEASKKMNSDTDFLISINFKDFKNSQIFHSAYNQLLNQNRSFYNSASMLKTACKIDPVNEIEQIIVTVNPVENVLVFVKFANLNEQRLNECVDSMNSQNKMKLELRKKGNMIEFAEHGKDNSENPFGSWLEKNTLLLSSGKNAQNALEKVLAADGNFLKQGLAAQAFKRINRKSTIWGYTSKEIPVSQQSSVKYATGMLDVKNGKILAEIKFFTANAISAKNLQTEMKAMLAQTSQDKNTPRPIKTIMKSLKLEAEKEALVFKLSETEKNMLSLIHF